MRRLVLFLTVLLSLGCGGSSSADRGSASAGSTASARTLSGQVTREGLPVAGAFLVVSEAASGLVPEDLDPGALFTADDGRFRLEVPPGAYTLVAVGPQGWRAEADVDLSEEQVLDLVLTEDRQAILDFVRSGPTEPSEEAPSAH